MRTRFPQLSKVRWLAVPLFGLGYLISLLLSGCAHEAADGPPLYPVEIAEIRNAVPKPEPKSRYGNPASYQVYGKRYHVMESSENYHQRGIASWYGRKFHGRRTSSGEPYDMLQMTAAHRRLPLPTYAKVTNLENGREIIVKINDRGPFKDNRLIDLSYAAALKLGMLRKGTALVDLQALSPYQSSELPLIDQTVLTAPKPKLYLQVGAFSSQLSARLTKRKIAKLTKKPVQIVPLTHPKQTLYRVQIGPLVAIDESDLLFKRLQAAGFKNPWTVISNQPATWARPNPAA